MFAAQFLKTSSSFNIFAELLAEHSIVVLYLLSALLNFAVLVPGGHHQRHRKQSRGVLTGLLLSAL